MPYSSDAQRKFFHTDTAKKAGITNAEVREFDQASKGKKLPEHVKKMADGGVTAGNPRELDPGVKDATATDFLLPFLLGPAAKGVTEELPAALKGLGEAGELTLGRTAPAMEEAAPGEVTAYVKGIQKGAPGTEGVKIYGVKGSPEKLKELFGDEAPGSVPENILRQKGILPADTVNVQRPAPNAYAEGGVAEPDDKKFATEVGEGIKDGINHDSDAVKSYLQSKLAQILKPTLGQGTTQQVPNMAEGGYPHVTFMENETPEIVKKVTHLQGAARPATMTETGEKTNPPHMAEGGVIHKAESRNAEPAKPKDTEMSHEEKLKSIYKAMGMKKYADGGEVSPNDGAVDVSQLPGGGMGAPSPNDPGFWDEIKAALSKVAAPVTGAANAIAAPAQAIDSTVAPALAPAAAGALNSLAGTNLPVPAPAPAIPSDVASATPPAAIPKPPIVAPIAPVGRNMPSGAPNANLNGLFTQDTSKLTAGVNPEDRQALATQMQKQQHGLGGIIAESLAGLGDALAAKGGKEQHSLQNIFSMQKDQRAETLANFDTARQDRLQKLDLQTKMGDNAIQQLAAKDAYGTDEHLNKMLGAPAGTAHKDLPLYFQAKTAQVAASEKDADLYMKAHLQASTDVDNAVKNAGLLNIKPSAAQLQASGAKLADNYFNRAKGNILVKPSDGSPSQWIPAANIGKAKQMDPSLQIIPG